VSKRWIVTLIALDAMTIVIWRFGLNRSLLESVGSAISGSAVYVLGMLMYHWMKRI
jgi:hypothetical protein